MKTKLFDWNCQHRMAFAWLCLAIDYPYYEGINEDIAIQWKELDDEQQKGIKQDYPHLVRDGKLKKRIK